MKALILGRQGQLARALQDSVPSTVELCVLGQSDLDISDKAAVRDSCAGLRPEVIINAAAFTNVDGAEKDPARAFAVNAQGARNLALAAQATNARFLHVSTDYVFAGDSSDPYQVSDPTGPLNVYGQSKLEGEHAVTELLPARSIILRTSWVYSPHGHNFLKTMLRVMGEKRRVRVVNDQRGTPTAAHSIAETLWDFAQRPQLHGIFHWTDAGAASWYEFAVAIAEESRALGLLPEGVAVEPITSLEYPVAARRPRFSLLDSRATVEALGRTPIPWRERLRQVLKVLQNA